MANPKDLERALAGDKNLRGADLTNADLSEMTDFRGADLTQADFTGAVFAPARSIKWKGAIVDRAKGLPRDVMDFENYHNTEGLPYRWYEEVKSWLPTALKDIREKVSPKSRYYYREELQRNTQLVKDRKVKDKALLLDIEKTEKAVEDVFREVEDYVNKHAPEDLMHEFLLQNYRGPAYNKLYKAKDIKHLEYIEKVVRDWKELDGSPWSNADQDDWDYLFSFFAEEKERRQTIKSLYSRAKKDPSFLSDSLLSGLKRGAEDACFKEIETLYNLLDEERVRREKEERLVEASNELENIKKQIKKTKSHRALYKVERTLLIPLLEKIKDSDLDDDPDLWEEKEQALDCIHRRKEQLDRERKRREKIEYLKTQVTKAKGDKELESLAQEVGKLQAQPEYVKEYKKVLDDLQAKIEEKYSVVGKGMRFIKKLFSRGRRASQIRTASQMLNQLNKEIADLKKEL